jgi:RNA polymerase sigma-70 factor (ECF subfamily)
MLATSANGQPAAAAYTRDQYGNYQSYGICVLTVTGAGIRRISFLRRPKTGHRVRVPAGHDTSKGR